MLISFALKAQVTFQYAYDHLQGFGNTVFKSIIKTNDGGFAIAGETVHTFWTALDSSGNEVQHYTSDLLLIKTDSSFIVQWTKVYYSVIDLSFNETGVKVKEKENGGFVLLCQTKDSLNMYYEGNSISFISTNVIGEVNWSQSFYIENGNVAGADFILDETDQSLIVVGSASVSPEVESPMILKCDSTGLLLWCNTYTYLPGSFNSILKVPSSGYLIAGESDGDAIMIHANNLGAVVFKHTYSDSGSEAIQQMIRTNNGYALLINDVTNFTTSLLYIDTMAATIGVTTYNGIGSSLFSQNNFEYVMLSEHNASFIRLFKTDLTGSIFDSVLQFSAPSIFTTGNDLVFESAEEFYFAGTFGGAAYLTKGNFSAGIAGGCNTTSTAIESVATSLVETTSASEITSPFLIETVDALAVSEDINVSQYVLCQCFESTLSILTSGDSFCEGDSVLLSSSLESVSGYNWFADTVLIAGAHNMTYTVYKKGNYQLSITGNCGTITSPSLQIKSYPSPVVTGFQNDTIAEGSVLSVFGYNLLDVELAKIGDYPVTFSSIDEHNFSLDIPYTAQSGTVFLSNVSGCSTSTADSIYITDVPAVEIEIFVEGLYYNNKVTREDTVTIEIHEAISPYNLVDSFKLILKSNGKVCFPFSSSLLGNSYYFTIKHRNTIETWSYQPVQFSINTFFSFANPQEYYLRKEPSTIVK